jgi:hypothetical protein
LIEKVYLIAHPQKVEPGLIVAERGYSVVKDEHIEVFDKSSHQDEDDRNMENLLNDEDDRHGDDTDESHDIQSNHATIINSDTVANEDQIQGYGESFFSRIPSSRLQVYLEQ